MRQLGENAPAVSSFRRHARVCRNGASRLLPGLVASVLVGSILLPVMASSASGGDASSIPEASYNWTGFYFGGHLGYAWGNSNWTSGTASGSFSLAQQIDNFKESGSFFAGVQAGYNRMLANRVVIGAEADASFPAYPDPITGLSIGGISTLLHGTESYGENVFASGALRARIGYAPGNWLYYATGGLAWTDDQFSLIQTASGVTASSFMFRLGWAAGAGIEGPIAPHWTARLEYLFKDYGSSSVTFPPAGQRFTSDLSQQELRVGLNYQFGDVASSEKDPPAAAADGDRINFHAQATGVWQGYPAIRSPYEGPNSLPGGGQGRETVDTTLYIGFRLWQGAEFWVDPEIDQGFGAGNTHGVAGFPSAEAYKLGLDYPYARLQRYFIRDTLDLGGATEKVEADQNQFAGSTTADRLVLWAGRFFITDLFDTNKYANNPKTDFLNWALVNGGTFDYAGDAWGCTYGVGVEWYQGRWTLRGGIFDLSTTPAGGISPLGGALDNTFKQFQLVGEIEERHELAGQPGKLKITGYLEDGRMGAYADAIAYIESHPLADPGSSIDMVRHWNMRPGVSLNLEQQVTGDLGVFARAGWADGKLEPWDFTDIDRTLSAGVSLSGKQWGRPDDRIGIAGIINGISSVHEEFFNLGGLGILIGDGQLPHPGIEKIIESYYSYSLDKSTKISVDYQLIDNPGYNTDRGPANVFSGRVHWQF